MYHIFFISSSIQGYLVYFQVFLIIKNVVVLVCDFIFSWSPKHTLGRRNLPLEVLGLSRVVY